MAPHYDGVDWQLECGQIRQRAAHLLTTGLWADCRFLLGPDKVPVNAHKLILAMASPVFQAMFYGPIAEGNSPISVPDIQPDIFMKVLQYVYIDDIDLDNYVIGFELYYAAQKYMLPHLQTVCTAYLSGNLVPQNACRIYEFAELIGDKELETESLMMLKSNTELALSDGSIEELAIDTVIKIFSMDDININSELVLLDAAERYYLSLQNQKDLKSKSLNMIIGNDNSNDDVATHSGYIKGNLQIEDFTKNDDEKNFDCVTEEETYCKNSNEKIYSGNSEETINKNEEIIQAEKERGNYEQNENYDYKNMNSSDYEDPIEIEASNQKSQNVAEICVMSIDDEANETKCDDNKQNEENEETGKQDYAHKLINPIRFLTLSVNELAEYKPKSMLLTELDIMALIMNIASSETYIPLPDKFSTSRERRCYNP